MKHPTVWLAPSLLFVLLLARPTATPSGETVETPAQPQFTGEIVIGATFPLSGELESYGQSAYYGANTRVRMINAEGGVNGKRLVLEWRDNRSDPAQAVADVRELGRISLLFTLHQSRFHPNLHFSKPIPMQGGTVHLVCSRSALAV